MVLVSIFFLGWLCVDKRTEWTNEVYVFAVGEQTHSLTHTQTNKNEKKWKLKWCFVQLNNFQVNKRSKWVPWVSVIEGKWSEKWKKRKNKWIKVIPTLFISMYVLYFFGMIATICDLGTFGTKPFLHIGLTL